MTINHSRLEKLFISLTAILKMAMKSSQMRYLLTFFYRQSIFLPTTSMKQLTIENLFSQLNKSIHYTIFNHYPARDNSQRTSCTGTEELIQLMALVNEQQPKMLLEMGTNHGGTTYNFFLNTTSECQIYTVDMNINTIYLQEIENAFNDSRVKRVTCHSKDILQKCHGLQFDFIFIDAGHDYDEVKVDTENAFKLLSPKGVVVWHDFSSIEPGVVHYLNELSQTKNILHLLNGSLVVYFTDLETNQKIFS